ncbi:MAG: tetratricopeptide repeat protein [Ilumatobacter sp.]
MFARRFAIIGLVIAFAGIAGGVFAGRSDAAPAAGDVTELDLGTGRFLDADTGIGSHEEIVAFFTERVANRPNDHISATNLSAALTAQARHDGDLELYERAEAAARAALAISPDDVAARLQLATALQAQHDFADALAIGQAVLADDPSSIDAVYVIGDAHFEMQNYDLASIEYDRLEAEGRHAAVVARLARLASATGDDDRAVDLSREALELSTAFSLRPHGRAYYHFQLGHHLFKAGAVDEALDALADAFEIAPDHLGTIEELATVNAAIGEPEAIVELHGRLAVDEQDHLVEFLSTRAPKIAEQLATAS